MASLRSRLRKGWNAFFGRDPTPEDIAMEYTAYPFSYGTNYRPDRYRGKYENERTIVSAIYNRISVDCGEIDMFHVRVDDDGNFQEIIDDELHQRLTLDSNIDQTSDAFMRDVVYSLLDEGCIAVVPTDTSIDPELSESFEIYSMRVGKILEWYPEKIKVRIYNELTGKECEIFVPKHSTAIIENPFYPVMNDRNSTLQRLKRTLAQIDKYNGDSVNGPMDVIIQLPYMTRSKVRKDQAAERKAEIEKQLENSKYGIGYIDGTEKVIQLNRPLNNNLWEQAKDLQEQLYAELSISQAILDGTADEKEMLNYYNQTINPILTAISKEFMRKFISKTARTQKQAILYFKDRFKLAPLETLAEIGDKFTRNEILSSNEMRSELGYRPSADPRADELKNKNIADSNQEMDPYEEEMLDENDYWERR